MMTKVASLLREESQRRDEAFEREARLRTEGQDRVSEAFHASIREERRAREREDLRLEGKKNQVESLGGTETVGVVMEQRAIRQSIVELQDRLLQAENRQKNAEERTVGMLDAIMSGLTAPPQE